MHLSKKGDACIGKLNLWNSSKKCGKPREWYGFHLGYWLEVSALKRVLQDQAFRIWATWSKLFPGKKWQKLTIITVHCGRKWLKKKKNSKHEAMDLVTACWRKITGEKERNAFQSTRLLRTFFLSIAESKNTQKHTSVWMEPATSPHKHIILKDLVGSLLQNALMFSVYFHQ